MGAAADVLKCLVTGISIWTIWITLKPLTTNLSYVCWLLSAAYVCTPASKAWQGMNWRQSRLALAFALTHPTLWHHTAFLEWEFWEETLCATHQMGFRGFKKNVKNHTQINRTGKKIKSEWGNLFGLRNPLLPASSSEFVVNSHTCCEKKEAEKGLWKHVFV